MSNFIKQRRPISTFSAAPVTLDGLRLFFDTFGKESTVVTLVQVEGGYEFRTHSSYAGDRCTVLQTGRTRRVRVFKDIESAVNVARKFGFQHVQLELSDQPC